MYSFVDEQLNAYFSYLPVMMITTKIKQRKKKHNSVNGTKFSVEELKIRKM